MIQPKVPNIAQEVHTAKLQHNHLDEMPRGLVADLGVMAFDVRADKRHTERDVYIRKGFVDTIAIVSLNYRGVK